MTESRNDYKQIVYDCQAAITLESKRADCLSPGHIVLGVRLAIMLLVLHGFSSISYFHQEIRDVSLIRQ